MKAEELRELDAEELSGRLKGARRELYELRFRMAVGQLDNPRQIGIVRKDIARILTIVHERRLDEEVAQAYGTAEAIIEERPVKAAAEETPEQVEDSAAAEAEPEASTATATATEDETEDAEAPAEPEAAAEQEAEAAEPEAKPRSRRKAKADDGEEGE